MRKVKDRAAASMARKRWSKLSAEERRLQVAPAHQARRQKAAARRAAREAEAQLQPETVEA